MLYQIIIASIIGGLLSLVGGLILLWKEEFAKKISFYLISFAAGSLLGAAFFDILPEALEGAGKGVLIFVLLGIVLVLVFEQFLGYFHHHDQEFHSKSLSAHTVLFGDTLHNFIDGVAIALAFSISPQVGMSTTFAVLIHEIPQEIGDFGVLIRNGYSKFKIIGYNLITAMATLVGAILTYFTFPYFPENTIFYGLALVAGTFIYISTSDLIPELREHTAGGFGLVHTLVILLGIVTVVLLSGIIPE
jgi:zinc and cadmium transporter